MAFTDFAFNPVDGLKNATSFPDPETPGQLRAQVQTPSDQLKDFLNGTHKTELTALEGEIDDKEDALVSFVDDTASRTLALTDARKKLRAAHASVAINYTVPPNADVAFPIGTWIIIEMTGAAQVAVVAGAGVTIKPATKLKVNGQDTSAVLVKEATDTWSWQGSVKA
jgi:hypothetical protein